MTDFLAAADDEEDPVGAAVTVDALAADKRSWPASGMMETDGLMSACGPIMAALERLASGKVNSENGEGNALLDFSILPKRASLGARCEATGAGRAFGLGDTPYPTLAREQAERCSGFAWGVGWCGALPRVVYPHGTRGLR